NEKCQDSSWIQVLPRLLDHQFHAHPKLIAMMNWCLCSLWKPSTQQYLSTFLDLFHDKLHTLNINHLDCLISCIFGCLKEIACLQDQMTCKTPTFENNLFHREEI